MADEVQVSSCDLSRIAKLNGDFRRNYGTLLGAFLYLRSIECHARAFLAVGRPVFPRLLPPC